MNKKKGPMTRQVFMDLSQAKFARGDIKGASQVLFAYVAQTGDSGAGREALEIYLDCERQRTNRIGNLILDVCEDAMKAFRKKAEN